MIENMKGFDLYMRDPIDIVSNVPERDSRNNRNADLMRRKAKRKSSMEIGRNSGRRSSSNRGRSASNRRNNSSVDISSNVSKRQSRKPARKKSLPLVILGMLAKTMLATFLIFVITGSIVVTALVIDMNKKNEESDINLKDIKSGYSTTIYAYRGKKRVKVVELSNGEKREWVDIGKIPKVVQDAFIYTEDERYETHEGVDWKRTIGAMANAALGNKLYGRQQGGSTITQQLIKNLTGDNQDSASRKMREIFKAMSLEKKYTKEDILEAYLNIIFLGNNVYGVQAASKYYFGKPVQKLNALEAASLAAMTRNPNRYDPRKYPKVNKERRDWVINNMRKNEIIKTDTERDKLLKTKLKTIPLSRVQAETRTPTFSWFTDNLIDEAIADIGKKYKLDDKKAQEKLYTGGYRIYSTVDLDMQETLEAKYNDLSTFSFWMAEKPESAMVIMDLNGTIKAVVGGRGVKTKNRIFNRATHATRQPGSTMKPIAVYAPAIDKDYITYSTILEDKPLDEKRMIMGQLRYWPNNYDNKLHGKVTVETALKLSYNTIPVRIINEHLTPQKTYKFLTEKLGITSLVKSRDAELGLGMGDIHKGTRLVELTASFQIFGNNGTYTKPHSYSKITNSLGETIFSHEQPKKSQVIGRDTSGVMKKLLQKVVTEGTGTNAAISNFDVIGKTGTSNSSKDQLFVGVTPYYVAGVWVGYDANKVISGLQIKPDRIWRNVMSTVLQNKAPKKFVLPTSVEEINYCTASGLRATNRCSKKLGYYKADNIPGYCSIH